MKHLYGSIVLFLIVGISVGCAGTMPSQIDVATDSIVTGRIEGRVVAKWGELSTWHGFESDEWKIKGFELKNTETGKVRKLRLDSKGHFAELVLPGSYVFQRRGKKSKDYPKMKTQFMSRFDVSPGKLINLGTYKIITEIIEGKIIRNFTDGPPSHFKAIWSFYHRSDPDSASEPLAWFSEKNPDIFEQYTGRIVDVLPSDAD